MTVCVTQAWRRRACQRGLERVNALAGGGTHTATTNDRHNNLRAVTRAHHGDKRGADAARNALTAAAMRQRQLGAGRSL